MTNDVRTRLCLGTVQFGLEYGVNNKTGKPGPDEVFAMLDYALEQGMNISIPPLLMEMPKNYSVNILAAEKYRRM